MTKWKVYFEIYGKHLVTEIECSTPHQAQEVVKSKLKFIKCEEVKPPPQKGKGDKEIMDSFKEIFGNVFS